ncbi:MAG: signal peptidase II [Gammaproteobacteria bacterium]
MARPSFAAWLSLAVVVAVLDQATKLGASNLLEYGRPLPVLPGFNLTLLHNTGAAFSLFHDQPGWQRWLFSAIALVVGAVVVFWMSRLDGRERWAPLALALILGGAAGNLVDRLRLGYVVDFIQVYYAQWSWPAFNVADSAIVVGAVMLILRGPRAAPADGDAAAQ